MADRIRHNTETVEVSRSIEIDFEHGEWPYINFEWKNGKLRIDVDAGPGPDRGEDIAGGESLCFLDEEAAQAVRAFLNEALPDA